MAKRKLIDMGVIMKNLFKFVLFFCTSIAVFYFIEQSPAGTQTTYVSKRSIDNVRYPAIVKFDAVSGYDIVFIVEGSDGQKYVTYLRAKSFISPGDSVLLDRVGGRLYITRVIPE
jgi:hypothetical protein